MRVWLSRALLLLPLLVLPVPLFADQEQSQQPSQAAETMAAPMVDKQHPQGEKPPAPKSFQPSEKISADSALAFPVDI